MGLDEAQLEKIAQAVKIILDTLGEDINRPGLAETPERVAKMYAEVFSGLITPTFDDFKLFEAPSSNEMILVKEIQFYSMCEHHLLPFFGHVAIAYIPKEDKVLGLSKLPRLVEYCAARPSVQEHLTSMIGEQLQEHIPTQGIAVMIEAEHMCMTMRGIKSPHSRTKTYYFDGRLNEPQWREEFLREINH